MAILCCPTLIEIPYNNQHQLLIKHENIASDTKKGREKHTLLQEIMSFRMYSCQNAGCMKQQFQQSSNPLESNHAHNSDYCQLKVWFDPGQ